MARTKREVRLMRRFAVALLASLAVMAIGEDALGASPQTAALQVGLRAHGFDPGPIDGVRGPLSRQALLAFQRKRGLECDGAFDRKSRRALGRRGRPLLGQRQLAVGAVGWDVAVLEFRLRRFGLPRRSVDGRFDRATAAALRRYQRRSSLGTDGIAGPRTYRSLASRGLVR